VVVEVVVEDLVVVEVVVKVVEAIDEVEVEVIVELKESSVAELVVVEVGVAVVVVDSSIMPVEIIGVDSAKGGLLIRLWLSSRAAVVSGLVSREFAAAGGVDIGSELITVATGDTSIEIDCRILTVKYFCGHV